MKTLKLQTGMAFGSMDERMSWLQLTTAWSLYRNAFSSSLADRRAAVRNCLRAMRNAMKRHSNHD